MKTVGYRLLELWSCSITTLIELLLSYGLTLSAAQVLDKSGLIDTIINHELSVCIIKWETYE